tara:strand:+ start:11458 stop:13503 length:2046 start_codon:yes stop_codon:yes gene_type:complete
MIRIWKNPMFLLGMGIKLLLIFTITAIPVSEWYIPFMQSSLSNFTLEPWDNWIQIGGSSVAFPYGYAMWLMLLPFITIAKLLGLPLALGYSLCMLLADFSLLILLKSLSAGRIKMLLVLYWLSPIVILATYVLGFNDIIPVSILIFVFFLIKRQLFFLAGFVTVFATSAKLSMVLTLPFFLIYILHNKPVRSYLSKYLFGILLGFVFTFSLFLGQPAAINMLFSNPEMEKIYSIEFDLGVVSIYLVPLLYFFILYAAWRIKRLNFELLMSVSGVAFLLIVLITPASPGWFIWAVPVLVLYQLTSSNTSILIVSLFSVLYMLSNAPLLLSALEHNFLFDINYSYIDSNLFPRAASYVQTLLVVVGGVLAYRLWREAVSRNDFFRMSRRPLVLGIAGDSGAGKDTLVDSIEGLFGSHSVTKVSGDDYHLWDRHKPMWQVMTHLNPMSNDLSSFSTDVLNLSDGKSIRARHYDHSTGKMTKPFLSKSNDIIIASGLHALYMPRLRDCYDLSIYLDIDEELRKYFKILRDVNQRGHSYERVISALRKRESDSERFIRPQKEYADLILTLKPIHEKMLSGLNDSDSVRFKLIVSSKQGFNELELVRALIGVCGLHVDIEYSDGLNEVSITIEGETRCDDVAMAASIVCPRIFEFLDIIPKWQDGVTGIMQLLVLSHINQALTKRFL